MSEMLKTMLNRIEHNKNALKTKRYYVEDLISNEELIILVEEIERLKSIIKEVREYIESGEYRFREGTDICLYQEGNEVFYMENDELIARKILSILDKENK